MSGSWSNSGTNLIILTEEISGFSGIFGYSPAPAAGNLVFSLSAAAGTDPYGNAYVSGLAMYSGGQLVARVDPAGGVTTYSSSEYISMSPAAGLFFGAYNPNTGTLLPSGAQVTETANVGLPWDQGTLDFYSPLGAGNNQLVHRLWSGYDSVGTGSAKAPHLLTVDNDASSPADHYISGSVISTSLDGTTPATWQTPTLASEFTNDNCQFRLLPFDCMLWQGEISMTASQAGAGSATIVAAMPAAYRPKKEVVVGASVRNSGGLAQQVQAFFAFEPNGTVMLGWGAATPAGARFSCDSPVGLGNIS